MLSRTSLLALVFLARLAYGFEQSAPNQVQGGVIGQQPGTADQQVTVWFAGPQIWGPRQLDPNDFVCNATVCQHSGSTTEVGGCIGRPSSWCNDSDLGSITFGATNARIAGPVLNALPTTSTQGEFFTISGRPSGQRFWGVDSTNNPLLLGEQLTRPIWAYHTDMVVAGTPVVVKYGANGAQTELGTTGSLHDASGNYKTYATTTGVDNPAGIELLTSSALTTTRQLQGVSSFTIKTDTSLANTRIWVGWFVGNTPTADTPTGAYAAVRYSTTGGESTWQLKTSDSAVVNTVNTGVSVFTNTRYDIRIDFSVTTDVRVTVNGVSVLASSGNNPTALPNSSTAVLSPVVRIICASCSAGRLLAWEQMTGSSQ